MFFGDVNQFFGFRTTIAHRLAANVDVLREVVIVPNHITNRQTEMLPDGTMKAELTRDARFTPTGDHIVKADVTLQIVNQLGGVSTNYRAAAQNGRAS